MVKKFPAKLFETRETVKEVSEGMTFPFLGFEILTEGRLSVEGIRPIGAGLQLRFPPLVPSVTSWLAQKLMKLFVEVNEGVWPEVQR